MENIKYLYETKSKDFELSQDEENIIKQMRKLDSLWKKYKSTPNGNKLILFGGGGCSIRYGSPSADNEIESFPHITSDGGDGGDNF